MSRRRSLRYAAAAAACAFAAGIGITDLRDLVLVALAMAAGHFARELWASLDAAFTPTTEAEQALVQRYADADVAWAREHRT